MRCSGLLLCLCAFLAYAQTAEDPEIARARIELNRIQAFVETGALPRAQLQKAQDALDDATDAVALRKSASSQEMTVDQANEVVAAATRRFDRRKRAYDDAKRLVDIGAAATQVLDPLQQDMNFAQQQLELAETRAGLAQQIAAMAEAEAAEQARMAAHAAETPQVAERFDGNGVFTPAIFASIESAYAQHFGKPLPVSANGETAVHRALGFDHRGRVDIALRPDQTEGMWLRDYLRTKKIPYFAFMQAVPGKATGAHIHLGLPSTHLLTE